MTTARDWKQFYVSPEYILEFAELLMELELPNSIGREGDYVLVDVGYDPDDDEHKEAMVKFQALDDAGD